jgi:hypothetical protein
MVTALHGFATDRSEKQMYFFPESFAEPFLESATHEREGEEKTKQGATEERVRSSRLVGRVDPD